MADKTPQERIDAYLAAYRGANPDNEPPKLIYFRGWYQMGEYPSKRNCRAWEIDDFTIRLIGRAMRNG